MEHACWLFCVSNHPTTQTSDKSNLEGERCEKYPGILDRTAAEGRRLSRRRHDVTVSSRWFCVAWLACIVYHPQKPTQPFDGRNNGVRFATILPLHQRSRDLSTWTRRQLPGNTLLRSTIKGKSGISWVSRYPMEKHIALGLCYRHGGVF